MDEERAIGELSAAVLREETEEEDVGEMTEMMLRERGVTAIPEELLEQLTAVQLAALSHNALTHVRGFGGLTSLVHLNINFNRITSLDGIDGCAALEVLHASNNRIESIAPLAACTRLRTISLFKNSLSDLDSCMQVLEQLTDLKELEMEANPCSYSTVYAPRLICDLNLQRLDGSVISAGDRMHADDVLVGLLEGGSQANSMRGGAPVAADARRSGAQTARPSTAPLRRPATAGAGGRRQRERERERERIN